jgi:hypothetical protein
MKTKEGYTVKTCDFLNSYKPNGEKLYFTQKNVTAHFCHLLRKK